MGPPQGAGLGDFVPLAPSYRNCLYILIFACTYFCESQTLKISSVQVLASLPMFVNFVCTNFRILENVNGRK